MGLRNHLNSGALIRKKIKKVVLEKHREKFGVEAFVRVEPAGFRNNLNLFVVSPIFSKILWDKSISMVMGWLEEEVPPRVHNRIVGVLTLTPRQGQQLFGRAV